MKHIILASLALSFFFSACKNDKTSTGETESVANIETYSIQPAFTTLEWTAYKTTARIGVSGTFSNIKIEPAVEDGDLKELLVGLKFSIDVASTDSKNEERDPKIIEHFFGTMIETESIDGEIVSINGNDSAGTARISLRFNGHTHEIDGNYTKDGLSIELKASVAMGDWKAEPSIAALNKVCDDLHKGEDGISKLWPDVDIVVKSTLKQNVAKAEKAIN
jgi:hypothetical protein